MSTTVHKLRNEGASSAGAHKHEGNEFYQQLVTKLSRLLSVEPRAELHCSWFSGLLETIRLSGQEKVVIGAAVSDDIRTDAMLSQPSQACICWARRHFYIQVLDNKSVTLVNHKPVYDARVLHNGDLIQVGNVFVVFTSH